MTREVVGHDQNSYDYIRVRTFNGPSLGRFSIHDYVITWMHFPYHWPFVGRIHRSSMNFPHKGPVMRSVDISFNVGPNKLLNKPSSGQWFEILWHHVMSLYWDIWSSIHGGTTEEGNCSYRLPLSHRAIAMVKICMSGWCNKYFRTVTTFPGDLISSKDMWIWFILWSYWCVCFTINWSANWLSVNVLYDN